jgi:hypothetical protein
MEVEERDCRCGAQTAGALRDGLRQQGTRFARTDPKHEHCPTIFEGFGARSIDGTTVDQIHITTDASCVSIADVDKLKDSLFGPITVQQNAKGTQPKP